MTSLSKRRVFIACMHQTRRTWHENSSCGARSWTAIFSLPCVVRFEARHVQECGGYIAEYTICLVSPVFLRHFLTRVLRRQARCVSRRCVFRVVAPDRIIFPQLRHSRPLHFRALCYVTVHVISCKKACFYKAGFPTGNFRECYVCVGPANRICISVSPTNFHVFISDRIERGLSFRQSLTFRGK